jgi:hypothetical protein
VESPKYDNFCIPINSLFFCYFFLITIDEEIHVLFIRIFCLRTLEVHTFEAVTRHNISQFLALMINEIKKVFLKLIKV